MTRLRLLILGATVSAVALALALYDVASALSKVKPSESDEEPDVWPGDEDDEEVEGILAQINVWRPRSWRANA